MVKPRMNRQREVRQGDNHRYAKDRTVLNQASRARKCMKKATQQRNGVEYHDVRDYDKALDYGQEHERKVVT